MQTVKDILANNYVRPDEAEKAPVLCGKVFNRRRWAL
jgi:predicted ATP-dependent Lon-type protease